MPDGIITNGTFLNNGNGFLLSGAINPRDLKHFLLYWDKILYPLLNGSGPNLNSLPDLAYLEKTGILYLETVRVQTDELLKPRSFVDNKGSINGILIDLYTSALATSQVKLAKNRINNGEIWSIAQCGEELKLPPSNLKESPVLEFSLYNCLPTPADSVSFEDIINFRVQHSKELSHLHNKLENYRRAIASSDNPEREMILAKKELTSLVGDISNLMTRKKLPHYFLTFKNLLDSNSILPTILGGTGGAALFSLTPGEGALLGYGLGIGLNITQKIIQGRRELPEQIKDYVYLYSAGSKKII